MKNRVDYLDYAKGIIMCFLIAIHVGFYQINSVVLFAMPLFFMATGFTFNLGKRSLKENVSLRFKSIMIPFWIFMLIYTGIDVLRAILFGYGSYQIMFPSLAKAIYGSGIIPFDGKITAYLKEIMSYKGQPVNGVDLILPVSCHLWFLPAMFTAYVMFNCLVKATLKNIWIKVCCIVGLLLVASLEVLFPIFWQLPFGIGRGAIGAGFMLVGYWLKDMEIFEKKSKLFHLLFCAVSVVVFVVALCLGSDGSSLVRSYYGPYGIWSVFLTFVGGVGGAILVLQLCKLIEKIPFTKLKNLLSFAGQNVMVLYVVHMVIKFLLDALYICVIHKGSANLLDEYKMGLLPQNSLIFMLIEEVVIVATCLLIAKLFKAVKAHARNK